MGHVFEQLIRKFAELANEIAGEHFTPREVIRLMVNLLFIEDDDALTKPGIVRSLYDPTAGTGGMLLVAVDHLSGQDPDARLVMHGQELSGESYATLLKTCRAAHARPSCRSIPTGSGTRQRSVDLVTRSVNEGRNRRPH